MHAHATTGTKCSCCSGILGCNVLLKMRVQEDICLCVVHILFIVYARMWAMHKLHYRTKLEDSHCPSFCGTEFVN